MKLSDELVLRCFPDRKTIEANIEEGIATNPSKAVWLQDCRRLLAANNFYEASKAATDAGYKCMSQAILFLGEGKIQ